MVQIDDKSLDEIEVLLSQSMKGVHHLFEHDKIAKILQIPTEDLDFFSFENMDKIQKLFNELIARESLDEKVQFLQTLDNESHEILLRTYFHIVDNTVLATTDAKH